MELNKKRYILVIIYFMAVFLALAAAINTNMASAAEVKSINLDKNGSVKTGTKDITVTATFGYNGKCKYGKSMMVNAVIENKGGDFAGKLRIQYARIDTEGSAMVQKTFAVASGESKKVQLVVPYIDPESCAKVALCDEKDEVICYQYVNVRMNDNLSMYYIATLSDNQDSLKYISNALSADKSGFGSSDEGYVAGLDAGSFPDNVRMLDSIDIIIIDDFDTETLSKDQVKAITDWVNSGGTLVTGGGADAGKVLGAFSGTLLNGKIGGVKTIQTNFGVTRRRLTRILGENKANKKVPLDITRLNIENASTIIEDGGEKLLTSVKYGKGNVLVPEFSLALQGEAEQLYGRFIVNTLKNNITDYKKYEMGLNTGSNAWNSYSVSYAGIDPLLLNETDALPNLKLYGTLLIIYVLLAGPLAYMVTKKKDKRNLLWVIVPVLSAAFSITIYILGTSTRIQKPYINYVSTMELPENGAAGNTDNIINTEFALTSSSNKSYEAVLPENTDIVTSRLEGWGYSILSADNMERRDYQYGIEYGADNTKLKMNSLTAFQSAYFKMNNQSSSAGTVDVNIKKKDGKLKGNVNNKLPYDLEDCIFFNEGDLYYIGELPAGKAFDISSIPASDIYLEKKYSYDYTDQLGKALGGNIYDSSTSNDIKRKTGMVLDYINGQGTGSSWFFGFVSDGAETGFTDMLPYEKYGATGVYKNASVSESIDGYSVIGSLEGFAEQYDENLTDGYYVYDDSSLKNLLEVTYKFPENFTLEKIIYNETTAGGREFVLDTDGYAETAFLGKASVKDKTTGKYVTLLESAKSSEKDGIGKYLEADGSLKIYYSDLKNLLSNNYYEIDSYTLPKVKLAGTYNISGKNRKTARGRQ